LGRFKTLFSPIPIFRRSYGVVPSEIAMVELDRLVVYQKRINLDHVERLKTQLVADQSPEAIFKFQVLPAVRSSATARQSDAHGAKRFHVRRVIERRSGAGSDSACPRPDREVFGRRADRELKDYFDPQLRKIVRTPRSLRQVRETFAVESVGSSLHRQRAAP
jgi:hypothetical protein